MVLSERELKQLRKEARDRVILSRKLSAKFGFKISLTDLNPHITAGRKFPASALTRSGKKIVDVGHANTRTKSIDVEFRVPRKFWTKIIRHEIEHIRDPRATEKQIEQITKKKFGFIKLPGKG